MEKKSQPLVSVIINCYNGESYLQECLESVKFQTYKNWEIIFWDNQSNDKSADIFKNYNDERFKYFYATKHTSLYEARNLAIKKASGELIAFIDTDDLWEKEKLKLQIKLFEDLKIDFVYSNLWLIKKNLDKKKKFIQKKLPSGFIYNRLLDEYNVGIITVIFRKNIIKNLSKIFDERFSIIGDFAFFLHLSKKYYFHYIDIPLAYYRIHDKNLSSVFKEKEMEEFNIWINENKKNLSLKKIKKIKIKINLRRLLHFKFNADYANCYKVLIESYKSITIFKMIIIVITPIFILRKISRFHS